MAKQACDWVGGITLGLTTESAKQRQQRSCDPHRQKIFRLCGPMLISILLSLCVNVCAGRFRKHILA
jgi:hypothetical protein